MYEYNSEPKLVHATRYTLPDGMFRFVGVYDDGFEVVLRAKATRPYDYVAIHSLSVTTKFRHMKETSGAPDRRQHVTFHSSSIVRPAHRRDSILQVLKIDEGA